MSEGSHLMYSHSSVSRPQIMGAQMIYIKVIKRAGEIARWLVYQPRVRNRFCVPRTQLKSGQGASWSKLASTTTHISQLWV